MFIVHHVSNKHHIERMKSVDIEIDIYKKKIRSKDELDSQQFCLERIREPTLWFYPELMTKVQFL